MTVGSLDAGMQGSCLLTFEETRKRKGLLTVQGHSLSLPLVHFRTTAHGMMSSPYRAGLPSSDSHL